MQPRTYGFQDETPDDQLDKARSIVMVNSEKNSTVCNLENMQL